MSTEKGFGTCWLERVSRLGNTLRWFASPRQDIGNHNRGHRRTIPKRRGAGIGGEWAAKETRQPESGLRFFTSPMKQSSESKICARICKMQVKEGGHDGKTEGHFPSRQVWTWSQIPHQGCAREIGTLPWHNDFPHEAERRKGTPTTNPEVLT
jgi:hypothetical protein